jgi:hypothetical protein
MIDIDKYLAELERRVALQPDEPEPEGLAPGDVVTIDAQRETLYVVGSEDDARLLIGTEPEIHRGMVWTRSEIQVLVSVADDPEVLAEIRRLKRTIPGRLIP